MHTPACIRQCVSTHWVEHRYTKDSDVSPIASRVRCVSDHNCCHSTQILPSTAQSGKKTFPVAHRREQKTTKFTLAIIALGNIRAKCSPKDLQEVKQFPLQVGEITNSMMSLKQTLVSKAFEKQLTALHDFKGFVHVQHVLIDAYVHQISGEFSSVSRADFQSSLLPHFKSSKMHTVIYVTVKQPRVLLQFTDLHLTDWHDGKHIALKASSSSSSWNETLRIRHNTTSPSNSLTDKSLQRTTNE